MTIEVRSSSIKYSQASMATINSVRGDSKYKNQSYLSNNILILLSEILLIRFHYYNLIILVPINRKESNILLAK